MSEVIGWSKLQPITAVGEAEYSEASTRIIPPHDIIADHDNTYRFYQEWNGIFSTGDALVLDVRKLDVRWGIVMAILHEDNGFISYRPMTNTGKSSFEFEGIAGERFLDSDGYRPIDPDALHKLLDLAAA